MHTLKPISHSCLCWLKMVSGFRDGSVIKVKMRLPMQETGVQSLIREDPTCLEANKALLPQLLTLCSRALEPQLLKPAHLESRLCSKRSHSATRSPLTATREKPAQQQRPSTAKKKKIYNHKKKKHPNPEKSGTHPRSHCW